VENGGIFMQKKENQRVVLTKRLLKEAFLEMFKTTPIDKIHIRSLCDSAGINRSTFYKYYSSPSDLLEEMENEMLLLIDQELRKHHSLSGSLVTIFIYLENNIEIARLIINSNVSGDFHKKLFSLPSLYTNLDSNIQGFSSASSKNYIVSFITTGYYQMIKDWINKDEREPINDMVKLVLSLYEIIISSCNDIQLKNQDQ
jgi:AcrR family transcriptional regulator